MKKSLFVFIIVGALMLSWYSVSNGSNHTNRKQATTVSQNTSTSVINTTTQVSKTTTATKQPTTATPKTTTTTTTKQTTTTASYDKLTELKEINNYSTAKDYLTNASDKDRIRLISKELRVDNLKGVVKNFTPVAYDRGDEKSPQPDNEYGYYAKIQVSEEMYNTLSKQFIKDSVRFNEKLIKDYANWWDISPDDVKHMHRATRGALNSSGDRMLTVTSRGFLVENNTEYYLYVVVSYSCVSDYYIRESKN